MDGLLELMIFKMGAGQSTFNGFLGSGLLKNTSADLAWVSFGQIGLALTVAGFCIRCIALMRLAVTGRGNVMEVGMKLIASIVAIMILRVFIG